MLSASQSQLGTTADYPLTPVPDTRVKPAESLNIHAQRIREQVRALLSLPNTAQPILGAELGQLRTGELNTPHPSWNRDRLLEKYGPGGPNSLEKRATERIFELPIEAVDLVETEDGQSIAYNFARLMNGRVIIGKYHGEDDVIGDMAARVEAKLEAGEVVRVQVLEKYDILRDCHNRLLAAHRI